MSRIYNSVVGLLCGMGILSSCEIIEYHPYDTRIEGEVGLTEKNIRLIEDKMRGRREFRFAMISDTQRRYDETKEVVLGNHDCLGTGFDVYLKVFGEDNFAFTVGNVRFICLNTNALEYDYSHPVPDFNFMEDELRNMPAGIEKTIVAMHVPPGDGEFNNNVGRAFEHYVITSLP